jgi:hypothetical protein
MREAGGWNERYERKEEYYSEVLKMRFIHSSKVMIP